MPLLPFKLFKDETRLIVHKKCLYKLKLTYKPDISSSKTLLNQKDEINAELTQVIRAIFFLINAKKNIPQKILTQFLIVSVAVKFWKIAQKLGFSKNGSRLKCGHLIELAFDQKKSRIQETNTEPTFLNKDVENENLQNLAHLGLRQFVINSDETDSQSSSSSDDITVDNSPEYSRSADNECNTVFSTDMVGQEINLDKGIGLQNDLHNQANPSDQTPLTSDQTVSLSAQALNKCPHLSAPLNETSASVQALPALISSCTQTDFEELDVSDDIPEINSEDKIGYHVPFDHDYLKSLLPLPIQAKNSPSELEVSNSNQKSAQLQENQASDQRLSAADMNSSLAKNKDNKDISISVDDDGCNVTGGDDDVGVIKSSCIKEINNPTESTKDAGKVEILNSETENNCLCSASNNSDSDGRNDVWGIGSRTLEVGSEVETAIQSQSDNKQDHPEKTSNPHIEKSSEAHQSSEQVQIQDGISSNTEKSESSPEKSESSLSKKRPKPKDKKPDSDSINIPRFKSLRSYNKVETILGKRPRTVKKAKISSHQQRPVPQRKKTPSNDNKHKQRQKQKCKMQEEVPTDVSFGLHDRYQVQTQELQEDLKLQDLANPSSSDTKKKRRSLLEYINFSYFLRRAKRPK